jgi:simple sugar transport system ATP-binding protein/ribose transport system ATP-binding protein
MPAPERIPHIEVSNLSKSFGGAQALRNVSLAMQTGSVHALVGENGAGKSTLGKIISGVVRPDGGTLRVHGRPVQYASPRDALADGTTIIAQELNLVPALSVLQNVFLGAEAKRLGFTRPALQLQRFEEIAAIAGFRLPPFALVKTLRVADQQKVEILRALARRSSLIVMDEPTAALATDETERLHNIVRRLREAGTSVIYVSHHLDEVLDLADMVTILRNGELIRTTAAADETRRTLIAGMLGRDLEMTFPPKQEPLAAALPVLTVEQLSRAGAFDDVSFSIRAGEIVGMAGLIGSGRSEVARAIFGADSADSGRVLLDGQPLDRRTPRRTIREGLAMLPESRKDLGLLMGQPIVQNVSLPHLSAVSDVAFVNRKRERLHASGPLAEVDVRAPSLDAHVNVLSGGNQQKVLFAKWLFRRPRVLIADEPTRGVDVGAKLAIYQLLARLAEEGMAILLISSELEEVVGLAHRVLVMAGGQIVAQYEGAAITQESVLHAAMGQSAVSDPRESDATL